MKRQKLLKNLKCRGSLLALLLTLVASLFTYNSVWADTWGFWDSNAWALTVKYGSSTKTINSSGTTALGVVTSFSVNDYWCKTWQTENSSNVCNAQLFYKFDSGSFQNEACAKNEWGGWTGEYPKKRDNTHYTNPSTITTSNIGNHTFEFYIKANGNNSSGSGCGDARYINDGGNNYKVTFTLPGFSPASASQTDFSCTAGSTQDKTISFTHYGTALAKGDCSLTGTDASSFEVKSISESGVTVTFKPTTSGTKKATLTITKDSKTCTITLQGEAAAAGSAPTVLIGAQATVTGSTADLYGYLKFTGCQNVTDFGFIWSDTEANISAATPTGTSVQASSPAAPIEVGNEGTEFELSDYLFQTAATKIYYKAYATNSQGTSYSDDYRELSITGCVKPAKPGDITGDETACKTIASAYSVAAVATATSYKWSLPEGWSITSGSGTNSITATPGAEAVAGDIKVCATNECGDGDYSNNFAVTVNPLAVAGTVSLSPNSICYGDAAPTVQVEGNVLGGGTGAWSSSNTTVATINADGTNLTIVGVGSTNITYTITGGCGGTKSASDLLTVNAVPEPGTVSATETSICADGTSTLSAQGTTAGVSYQWQKSTTSGMTGFEDIEGATSATYTASNLAAGNYWFRLKVTNAAGCNDISDAEQITVNANPSITLAGSGDKSATVTTPWEYMTITATTDFTPAWSLTTPAGFEENTDYVVETGAKTYKLKSKLTDNPDTDKFTVEATVTDSGSSCSTTAEYDVYINEADPEICN
ncbi:MAG: hypothetical protein MJ007_00950 [Paludibacteraceae bacterium]|nr:hypothetical protein [Paludibacteraceae bacterium]